METHIGIIRCCEVNWNVPIRKAYDYPIELLDVAPRFNNIEVFSVCMNCGMLWSWLVAVDSSIDDMCCDMSFI